MLYPSLLKTSIPSFNSESRVRMILVTPPTAAAANISSEFAIIIYAPDNCDKAPAKNCLEKYAIETEDAIAPKYPLTKSSVLYGDAVDLFP